MAEQKESSKLDLGWQVATGDQVALLKETMEAVKDQFIKKTKELFGFEPECYVPTDVGLVMLLMGGQHFIGVVRLNEYVKDPKVGILPPGLIIFANIRVVKIVGTLPTQSPTLEGFIIQRELAPTVMKPLVAPGEYLLKKGIYGVDADRVKDITKDTEEVATVATPPGIPYGFGPYLPYYDLNFVQGLVNKKEAEILEKVGLKSSDITQFRVTAALNKNGINPLRFGYFKAQIAIGEKYGVARVINVNFTNFQLPQAQPSVTINDVFLWG